MLKKVSKKESRAHQVLIGMVELYIESGKPIGSNTLREQGFEHLSSATIRNYFAELEEQGFLTQAHSSGGRIPTQAAFRLYAQQSLSSPQLKPEIEEQFQDLAEMESRNVTSYLQQAVEKLSQKTGYAVFLSSVRFDHDFILEVKLLSIDASRLLCVILTDFGQILTEILPSDQKLSSFTIKRLESYLQWRIKGGPKHHSLSPEEEKLAQSLYNEIIIRYLVRYSNFSDEDVFRTGFSNLLAYPEFNDPIALASGLSLFENASQMRLLLNDCSRLGDLCFWIGSDLASYSSSAQGCTILAIPYYVGHAIAGAIGILGPCRMPYKTLFGTLKFFSESLSKSLTKTLYKYKLSFRQPRSGSPYVQPEERAILDKTSPKLLEIKEHE